MDGVGVQMPRYKCHKEVWALKIAAITLDSEKAKSESRETDGSAWITPDDPGRYASFKVDHAYMHKHKPEVGGYYVVYDDGYKSFSPAKAFEEGYTRVYKSLVPPLLGLDAFKNERDYIGQNGRMKTTVAAMDWAIRALEAKDAENAKLKAALAPFALWAKERWRKPTLEDCELAAELLAGGMNERGKSEHEPA